MTKTKLLAPYAQRPELRSSLARLLDHRDMAQTRGQLKTSDFLSPEARTEAETLLARLPPQRHVFFGGYAAAERSVCVFLPDWMEEEDLQTQEDGPLCALKLCLPPRATPQSHRDYLGSLMALGLKREKFGDILCTEQGAQMILLREQAKILHSQWEKVGRYPIQLCELPLAQIEVPAPHIRELRESVASLRLDAVLAAGFQLSRARAVECITQGRVACNHSPCEKADTILSEGDVCSCRGLGKFELHKLGALSRKGRLQVILHRFE